MDKEQPVVRISVRNLLEFVLRSGDIDNRIAGTDRDAMLLGGKIHRRIQRMMGAGYQAEVPLKHEVVCKGFVLSVEGRADGVITRPEGTLIDEIKGIFRELEFLKEPVMIHLAQAKCYAYIYAYEHGLEEIGVQMTYCNMGTEEIKRFQSLYSFEELKVWFLDVLGRYEKWVRYQIEWRKKRNASIRQVVFPFKYRAGQKEVAACVYRTILQKKKLFIQAPTGVGKTISTVFPAVKAVGEELGEKIFYLTAKTIARTVAWQAFETLREQCLRMKVIVLTAKEKICFCEETACNPEDCPYAKGHYDRVNDAVYELITSTDELNREILEEQARKWQVCPHEMSLDVSLWADAVVCDYNYVFDPNAHLRRFFGEGVRGEYLFLIDEAHNLVERGRDMYSAEIYKEDFLRIRKLIKLRDWKTAGRLGECSWLLAERLEECNRQLLSMKRGCEGYRVYDSVVHIHLKLMSLMTTMERFMEECWVEEIRKEVLELYFSVRTFVNTHDRLDRNYLIYSELEDTGRFKLRLFCVNPANCLREFLEKGNSTVFFSATLLPIHYYKKLLSTSKEDYAIYAESPFDPGKRKLLLGKDASTKYTRRGRDMYRRYARYLIRTARAKAGNYMAFFPSYQFMEDVQEEFLHILDEEEGGQDIAYVMQSRHMSEEDRELFLKNFEEGREHSLMGFCVMGGIFSEGIDLAKDQLIGAVIVGTGLPQVCRERELLKWYFDSRGERGFDYAYLYPGMNKVLQSAGRVIRTDEDRGVILLLDERFGDRRYQEVFPREWSGYSVCKVEDVEEQMKEFWSRQE